MNTCDWPDLFKRSPGYLGTEVCKDTSNPRVYLTIDTWKSEDAFNHFLREHRADYDRLDSLHEELYESAEQFIGAFDIIATARKRSRDSKTT